MGDEVTDLTPTALLSPGLYLLPSVDWVDLVLQDDCSVPSQREIKPMTTGTAGVRASEITTLAPFG